MDGRSWQGIWEFGETVIRGTFCLVPGFSERYPVSGGQTNYAAFKNSGRCEE